MALRLGSRCRGIVSDFSEFDPTNQTGEVIQHEPATSERGLARRVALQILYEVDTAGHDPGSVTTIHLQARQISRKAAKYIQRVVMTTAANRDTLDDAIREFAHDWPIEQMSVIDRNILRLAICEFGILGSTPVGVAIDEAVGLARVFGAEGSPGFVNGVLGAIAEDRALLNDLRLNGAHGAGGGEEQDE